MPRINKAPDLRGFAFNNYYKLVTSAIRWVDCNDPYVAAEKPFPALDLPK